MVPRRKGLRHYRVIGEQPSGIESAPVIEEASVRSSGAGSHLLRTALIGAIVAVLSGAGLLGALNYLDASCNPLGRVACTRVLFVGNSYTYVNDLPTVFRHLARAAGENVETAMVAQGGETLAQHVSTGDAPGPIAEARWQFVVLQEQSEIPAVAALRSSEFYPAVRTLVGDIRQAGGTPVLLETWAHQAGWSDDGLSYGSMQTALDQGYVTIGGQLGVVVAPAGQAWQTAIRLEPGIALWQADGSHPTLAGTYLAACVLFSRIFGYSPVGISDTEGLPSAVAGELQQASIQQ